jgi:hypothetical protein
MPVYVFRDRLTGDTYEEMMSFKQRELFLDDNPHIDPVVTAPRIISGRGDGVKPDEGFKEVLSKIAEQNPQSPMAERFGAKDSKSVKTREAVKTAVKKSGGLVD